MVTLKLAPLMSLAASMVSWYAIQSSPILDEHRIPRIERLWRDFLQDRADLKSGAYREWSGRRIPL